MGGRGLPLKLIRSLAAAGLLIVGLLAVLPLVTGWRGPASDRQAILHRTLSSSRPTRAEIKLVATDELPASLGSGDSFTTSYVWVMAASNLSLDRGEP